MTRDFEYEGPLSDPAVQRAGDKRMAEANRILKDNLKRLSLDDDFLLLFQRYAYPVLAQDTPFHGADLERFIGRRSMIAQVIREMDEAVPGFLSRVIAARDDYESRLNAAEEK